MRLSPYSEETRRRAAQEALARKANGQRFFLRDVAAELGVRPATIRNWVAQYEDRDEGLPAPASTAELSPFPLRGILFCGLCDSLMAWGFSDSGADYHCVAPCWRNTPLDAQALHFETLHAVLASAPDFARGGTLPPIHAIPGVVSRVTVGAGPQQLTLRWRPRGFDRRSLGSGVVDLGGRRSGCAA